ncbi:AraC family transcriptional regulator [Couchioplanes azureus]|uniref:AraC family transcriptional regulator n=1 Tax=Couchioplanes caeruleus TaxID=56438 RepID=UPI0016718581|nr:AraC family transcriptional regulator [Couchioplanes caeruleus]GGQ77047.1 hypothetical protein GCM10010166_53740 [Couchioplanes caeruleus subsp. azureus]
MTTADATAPQTTTLTLTGADAIEQFLRSTYSGMHMHSDIDRPWLRHHRIGAGVFALDDVEQSTSLDFRVAPLHAILITRPLTSRMQRACGDADQRYAPGDLFIVADPDQPYTMRWLPGRLTTAVLDPGVLARVAATAPGRRPEPIQFTSLDPISAPAAAQWWNVRAYATELVGNAETAAPLILASTAQLLAAATLTTFPNTALTDPTIEDRHDAHPANLRRAISFIDDNAHHAISPADIATAAHVTIRTLQLAFRRHLETTPTGYLRRVRLDHAHRDLQAADPTTGATVSAIAARWGFANHSRFTAEYRTTYGITPSQTLRR